MPSYTKEQRKAIDLEGSNILVSAGAGSGKTAVLSERTLRKVKEGVGIDNLLILTFTNKAAAEMKSRIRNMLINFNAPKEELEKIESAYITTFDSFTLSVVKKYHYLLDLDKNIDICDAGILLLKKLEILDNIINDLYEKEDEAFINIIEKLTYKNDNDIKNFIMKAADEIDLIYEKEEFFNNFVDNYYSDKKIEELLNEYTSILINVIKDIEETYEELARCDSDYASKISINELLKSSTYDDIKLYSNIDIPRVPKGATDELKEEKDKLKKLLEKLEELVKYDSLNNLKEDYLSNKEISITILNIIRKYDRKLNDYKKEMNMYDFLGIEKLAIDLLKNFPEVRNYYKDKFNEILIDEYQDTSDIQETFVSYIAKNNVYMVGDIKQSIYRFRKANPDIFREKFNSYGKSLGGKRIDLNKNFRSRDEVLTNINLMFDYIMNDKIGGAEYKTEHQLVFGNTTYYEYGTTGENYNFEVLNYIEDEEKKYTNAEIEAFIIAKDIKDKISNKYKIYNKKTKEQIPIKYSDFAILLDRSKNFSLYKKIFEYLNIPLSISQDSSIKDSVNIKILKNILVLITKISKNEYDKTFKYAYLSVGRSYLFSMHDNDLHNIITKYEYKTTDIYLKCKSLSKDLSSKNIYTLFKEIINEFNIYEKIITIGDIENNEVVIEYLLTLTKNASKIYTIEEFINYLDNVVYGDLEIKYSVNKGEEEGVKLMSIHKSKGLEFPVVYFSGLYEKFNLRDLNERFIFDSRYGMIIPTSYDGLKTLFTKRLLKHDTLEKEISEKLRLLYVAMTRAEEKMIFIMDIKNEKNYQKKEGIISDYERMKYLSFKDILESINDVIMPYSKEIDINNLNLSKDYLLSIKKDYKKIIKPSSNKIIVDEYTYEKETLEEKSFSKKTTELFSDEIKGYINEGLNIHYIMENIDFNKPDLSNIDQNYIKSINYFLSLPEVNNYINMYKEYEFIYENNNTEYHGIIDLLIEKKDKFIIIDYKLKNTTSVDYNNQLIGYKTYIEKITNKPCEIYLYSFIDMLLINLEK